MASDSSASARHHRRRRSDIARRRLAEGIPPEQIKSDFVTWGVDPAEAEHVVLDAVERRRHEDLRHRVQPVWVGGSMLVVGVLLTAVGLQRSDLSDGGMHRFLVMGLMVLPAAAAYAMFGLAQILMPDGPPGEATQEHPASGHPTPEVRATAEARPEQQEIAETLRRMAA